MSATMDRQINTLFALVYVTTDGEWFIPIDTDRGIEPSIAQSLAELEQFRARAEIFAGAMGGRVRTVRFERVLTMQDVQERDA